MAEQTTPGAEARANGRNLAPYNCAFCGFWHLGHPPTMTGIELLARYLRFGSQKLAHESGEVAT